MVRKLVVIAIIVISSLGLTYLTSFVNTDREFVYDIGADCGPTAFCANPATVVNSKLYGFPYVTHETLVSPSQSLADYPSSAGVSGAALLFFRPVGSQHVSVLIAEKVSYPVGVFINCVLYSLILFATYRFITRSKGKNANHRH